MKNKILTTLVLFAMVACTDPIATTVTDPTILKAGIEVSNANAAALVALQEKDAVIVDFSFKDDNIMSLEVGGSDPIEITWGKAPNSVVSSLDADGSWICSCDGNEWFEVKKTDGVVCKKVDGLMALSLDGQIFNFKVGSAKKLPLRNAAGSLVKTTSGNTDKPLFETVSDNKASSKLDFKLLDGRSLSVPYINDLSVEVVGYKEGDVLSLGQTVSYNLNASSAVVKYTVDKPVGWIADIVETADSKSLNITAPDVIDDIQDSYDVVINIFNAAGVKRSVRLKLGLDGSSIAGNMLWNDFKNGTKENVLLDFSYAGYNHATTAPLYNEDVQAMAAALNYRVFNVMDYGAVPNDGKSDREAFKKAVLAALGGSFSSSTNLLTTNNVESAKAIIYFPEGEFILHTSDDDVSGQSQSLQIRAGDFIIKGAGRDKTIITMKDDMLPTNPSILYSSPVMLSFKHNSGLGTGVAVTSDADKGTFSVELSSATAFSAGQWVCLTVQTKDESHVRSELVEGSYYDRGIADGWNLVDGTDGVIVQDYHQIASISGNKVTFVEPIMHAVDASWGWQLCSFPHYSEIGIEDITFKGNAKSEFVHHASWKDDGAFKPIAFTRTTNSWIRNVRFESISEGASIISSANCSVYNIEFTGNRGHASVRSQGSSRVFLGAFCEKSSGRVANNSFSGWTSGSTQQNTGPYHGVGISKPSMGAVLWRNRLGEDSCFESHATQPRATLIDCCKGGWMLFRAGGDYNQLPNHLQDMTIWNYENTSKFTGEFSFWGNGLFIVKPIVAGFHGSVMPTFPSSEVLVDYDHGKRISPESLYESQLRLRLGAVPAWLEELKATALSNMY